MIKNFVFLPVFDIFVKQFSKIVLDDDVTVKPPENIDKLSREDLLFWINNQKFPPISICDKHERDFAKVRYSAVYYAVKPLSVLLLAVTSEPQAHSARDDAMF